MRRGGPVGGGVGGVGRALRRLGGLLVRRPGYLR